MIIFSQRGIYLQNFSLTKTLDYMVSIALALPMISHSDDLYLWQTIYVVKYSSSSYVCSLHLDWMDQLCAW